MAVPGSVLAVTAFLDTNVLIRHLIGHPPAQARRATKLLSSFDQPLLLSDLIVAEVGYVLASFYETPRAEVAALLRAVVASDRLNVADRPLLLRAIEVHERHRLDFADAYLVASAERTGVGAVVSFDRAIDRVGTVERVEP